MKLHMKISSAKWWPFSPGGDELNCSLSVLRTFWKYIPFDNCELLFLVDPSLLAGTCCLFIHHSQIPGNRHGSHKINHCSYLTRISWVLSWLLLHYYSKPPSNYLEWLLKSCQVVSMICNLYHCSDILSRHIIYSYGASIWPQENG